MRLMLLSLPSGLSHCGQIRSNGSATRLLYVAKDRTEASLNGFFDILDKPMIAGIKFACTDMWPAYLKVLKRRATQTLNILDRFHIAKKFGEALNGSSRILVASVQNGEFFEASTPASNGSPKSSLGGATFVETARTIGALSTGISLPKLRPRRA